MGCNGRKCKYFDNRYLSKYDIKISNNIFFQNRFFSSYKLLKICLKQFLLTFFRILLANYIKSGMKFIFHCTYEIKNACCSLKHLNVFFVRNLQKLIVKLKTKYIPLINEFANIFCKLQKYIFLFCIWCKYEIFTYHRYSPSF